MWRYAPFATGVPGEWGSPVRPGDPFPRGGSMRNRLLALPAGISLVAAVMAGTAGTAAAGAAAAAPHPAARPAPARAGTFDSRASATPMRPTRIQAAAIQRLVR